MPRPTRLLALESALKKGTDLWMVSDPEYSSWNQKIDWYLSYLMKKNRQKQDHQIKPLLMKTAHRLPNLWTVELSYKNKEQWLNQAHTVWKNLNRPSLRIFAPHPLSAEDIEKTWSLDTIQYVPSSYYTGLA